MVIHSPDFYDINLFLTDLLPIIFDTVASLSIFPYKVYFVVPITPLPEPRTLGGIGNVTPISDIGLVLFIFHTGSTSLTTHTHHYHVPNARACLLNSQQLFSARGGSTGAFTIGNKCSMLSLDGKPSLQIPYDSKSYLPVALSLKCYFLIFSN